MKEKEEKDKNFTDTWILDFFCEVLKNSPKHQALSQIGFAVGFYFFLGPQGSGNLLKISGKKTRLERVWRRPE